MKNLDKLIKDVERDFLINLVLSLKHKRITVEEVKKASKSFMTAFPVSDYGSLFSSLSALSLKSKEARKVFLKYCPSYYEAVRLTELNKTREKLKIELS